MIPVFDALMVAHPGEGDGGVEGNPPVRGEPVEEIVKLFPKQERLLVHKVAHLDKWKDQWAQGKASINFTQIICLFLSLGKPSQTKFSVFFILFTQLRQSVPLAF